MIMDFVFFTIILFSIISLFIDGSIPLNGTITFEGPHYPKPHRFYGQAIVENGKVVKIKN